MRSFTRLLSSLAAVAAFAAACGGHSHGGSTTPTPTPTATLGPPSIAGITPSSGLVGISVQIAGASFGATQGASTVTVDGVPATATSWSGSAIVATIPTAARPGADDVVVHTSLGDSNAATYTAHLPSVLYAADDLNPQSVLAFSIGNGGALTPLAGSPYTASSNHGSDGQYVGDSRMLRLNDRAERLVLADFHSMVLYEVNPLTGVLTTSSAPAFVSAFSNVVCAEISPDGSRIWGADSDESEIWSWTVDSAGTMTPDAVSPQTLAVPPTITLVSADGSYLYVVQEAGQLGAYSIAADGTLTALANSPYDFGSSSTSGVFTGAVDPLGRFLFFPDRTADAIWVWSIGPDGVPSLIAGDPFTVSGAPLENLAVSPDGTRLYANVRSGHPGYLYFFDIASDGTLTDDASSPMTDTEFDNASSMAVDATGRYVFSAYEGSEIRSYQVNATGSLTPTTDYVDATQSIAGMAATR